LIETMARDLNLRTRIVGGETVRDADGLAKSSRNRYLSDSERQLALKLSQGLNAAKSLYHSGERRRSALLDAFNKVASGVTGLNIEYLELRLQGDLKAVSETLEQPAVMLVAAKVGTTRLIDNMELA